MVGSLPFDGIQCAQTHRKTRGSRPTGSMPSLDPLSNCPRVPPHVAACPKGGRQRAWNGLRRETCSLSVPRTFARWIRYLSFSLRWLSPPCPPLRGGQTRIGSFGKPPIHPLPVTSHGLLASFACGWERKWLQCVVLTAIPLWCLLRDDEDGDGGDEDGGGSYSFPIWPDTPLRPFMVPSRRRR